MTTEEMLRVEEAHAALREENERLRAALKEIVKNDTSPVYRVSGNESSVSHFANGTYGQIARRALEQSPRDEATDILFERYMNDPI
jgi:hypothetical protein